MHRCCPPPLRKFEIKFALRRIGILAGFAVCILTFAATDAQAQTSCNAGETAIGGVCVPNAITVGAQNCVDANRDLSAANGGSCGINVTLFGGDLYDKCYFSGNSQPQCVDVFGAGLAFPEKSDPTRFTDPPFVYNCDPNGMTGLIPATINTIHTGSCRCPLGQETNSNGVCAAIECPDEERVVKNSTEAGCFANEVADIADACTANGWSIGGFIFLDELVCSPLSILYDDDSSSAGGTGCAITGADDSFPPCKTMFGDPPQFPTATGDDDKRNFVANCSRGGNIPGAIPATINTISATECTCDSASGYVGTWPNCACPTGGIVSGGVCTCTAGKELFGGACVPACAETESRVGGVCVPNAITVGAQNCVDANRDLSAANGGSCGINVTLFGGDLYDKCYFSGNSQPQCVDVFGAGLAFPEKSDPTRFTDPPFVYNCDPNGMTGLIPATINTIHTGSCRCPLGQETNSNGVCAAIECPDEERVVKNSTEAGCFANEVADIADACTANGWSIGGFIFLDELVCSPLSILYDDDSSSAGGTGCAITGADDSFPPCKTMFGDPPQFPTATGDDDKRNFVANCSRGGNIPGAIPATINTISATECTCGGPGGYVGDWPDCTCPSGSIIDDGACVACTGGRIPVNNVCQCPAGHELQNGTCAPTTEYLCATLNGWSYTSSDDSCGIKVTLSGSGTVSAECYMSGSQSPQCADIFGSLEDIPQYDGFVDPIPGSDIPFIYNCDPDGDNGLIPATINTIRATACECPALDQELNGDGVCAPIQCPEGQKLFVDELYSEYAGCHDAEIVDSAEDCRAKDWVARAVNFGRANLFCDIPFTRYLASGGNVSDIFCIINPAESSTVANKCRDLFGNPSQFPPATGDTDEDRKGYVTHCNAEGTIPGAIPATINLTGAKECSCDSAAGYVGDYPNCACPTGAILFGGVCTCPDEEFTRDDGTCGACPADQVPQNGFCTACPSGSIVSDGACVACTGGRIPVNNACTCPTGAILFGGVCTCPDGQGLLDNGSCGTCPPGKEVIDNVCAAPTVLRDLCEGAGWDFSTSENSCGVLLTLAGGAASDKCYISGSTSPKCADVFASTVHYFPSPTLAADGATLRFVYNCDPDGESGLIPATANTIAATECGCESGASFFSDVCIREEGDLGLADELLCGAFGGTVRTATGGREVCSGMDANDTFCIMDSAVGFPCRGLFKHLRSCNLEFNRKALNPFFCGEKCGVQKAVGSECR